MAKVAATHLVISCIDHRCTNDVTCAVHRLIKEGDPGEVHPEERYDFIALPGASLGAIQDMFPAWGEAFWQQVWAARALHPAIRHVFVFDHLDCGAYRMLYRHYSGLEYGDGPQAQVGAHEAVLAAFKSEAQRRFPELEVRRWVLKPTSDDRHEWRAEPLDGGTGVACK